MIILLLIFAAGIALGFLLRKKDSIVKLASKASSLAVVLLLFTLGFGVGANEEVRLHLDTLGLTALLIALFAIAGSLVTARITWYLFFREK